MRRVLFRDTTLWSTHYLLRPLIASNFVLTCRCYQTICTFPSLAPLSHALLGSCSYSVAFRNNYITCLHGVLSLSVDQFARGALLTTPRKWRLAMLNVSAVAITSIMEPCHCQGLCVWSTEFRINGGRYGARISHSRPGCTQPRCTHSLRLPISTHATNCSILQLFTSSPRCD